MKQRIGLLFGSFNPVHSGHIKIAKAGLEKAGCSEVWFMLQEQNLYKAQNTTAPVEDRAQMIRLAISNQARFKLGITRAKSMVAAVEKLQSHYLYDFILLMGQDLVESLPKWADHKKIIKRFHIYAYQRHKQQSEDISSQRIREVNKQSGSLAALTPKPVEEYIKQHKLYW